MESNIELGRVVTTPNALEKVSQQDILNTIARFLKKDWGEMDEDDKKMNDEALKSGARLLGAYESKKGIKFWIITEADRSVTTILLPEDY